MFSIQRAALVAVLVVGFVATVLYTSSIEATSHLAKNYFRGATGRTERLHLVLPATGPNKDFCRFLLSNTILAYPDPICIGWEGHGHWNGTESHLFKVSEGLAYLKSLPEEQDNELVLMLDAYDMWMLLRPEIIISRYNKIMKQQEAALKKDKLLGKLNRGEPITNTLLFGADKICWPRVNEDAGCWALPDSPLRPHQYGPDTDKGMVHDRARWLNSGTLMGPVKHMRDMFNATMENIERKWDEEYFARDSDQYYFSDLWAEQQLTRMEVRDGKVTPEVTGKNEDGTDIIGFMPDIPKDRRTEYHLTVDYKLDIFQTAAGFTELLTWMSFNHTTPRDPNDPTKRRRVDQVELPKDVQNSRPPFDTPFPHSDLPTEKGWEDVILGTDVVEQNVYPLYHLTGNKNYRDTWWHYAWFHPHAKALLEANSHPKVDNQPEILAVVDGVKYIAADTSTIANASWAGERGGIWTDQGERIGWSTLCGEWESDPSFYLK